jgi:hypothetical protein
LDHSIYTRSDNTVRELNAGKTATYLIDEYHCGRLQSTSARKLCTDVSA